jgi:hypothetical protein
MDREFRLPVRFAMGLPSMPTVPLPISGAAVNPQPGIVLAGNNNTVKVPIGPGILFVRLSSSQ